MVLGRAEFFLGDDAGFDADELVVDIPLLVLQLAAEEGFCVCLHEPLLAEVETHV